MNRHAPLAALLAALLGSACSNTTITATAADAGATADVPAMPDVPAFGDVPGSADAGAARDVPVTPDVPRTYTVVPALSATPVRTFSAVPDMMLAAGADYRADIETDVGTIHLDLLEAIAPNTVNSFVFLARSRFFEGIAFHRVINNFVAQGGDPNTVSGARTTWGRGGPGYAFGLEVDPDTNYDGPGVVGMARSASPDSNGSQFFITLAPTHSLDQMYTIFGRVLGPDDVAVLGMIARGEPPANPTRITSVTIRVAGP